MDEEIFKNFKSNNSNKNITHVSSNHKQQNTQQSELLNPEVYKQSIPYYKNKQNNKFDIANIKNNALSPIMSPGSMNDFPVRDFYNTPTLHNGSEINLPVHPSVSMPFPEQSHSWTPQIQSMKQTSTRESKKNRHIDDMNRVMVPDIPVNISRLHEQPVPDIGDSNSENNYGIPHQHVEIGHEKISKQAENQYQNLESYQKPNDQDNITNNEANTVQESPNNDEIFFEKQRYNINEPPPLVFDSQSVVNSINSQKLLEGKLYSQVLQKPLFITPFFLQDSLGIEKDAFTVNSLMHIFEISLSIAIIAMCGNSLNNDSQVQRGVFIFLIVISVILLIVSLMFLFRVMKFDRNNGIFYCFLATILSIATMWVSVAELLPVPCVSIIKSVASSSAMINDFSKKDTYYYLDNSNSGGANLCSLRKAETALISICSMVWFINLVQFIVVFYISRLDFRKGFDEKEIRDTILRNRNRGGTSRTDDTYHYYGSSGSGYKNYENERRWREDPEKDAYGNNNYQKNGINNNLNGTSNNRNFSGATGGPGGNNFYNEFIKIYSDTASDKYPKRYSEKTLVG